MQLSSRRKRIARGDVLVPETRRRRLLADWARDGFDVSDFVGLMSTLPPCNLLPPAIPVSVDVVVPFCSTDAVYVAECVTALLDQQHADVRVHLINDGAAPWPIIPAGNIVRYITPETYGPYRATNAIFHNLRRSYVALNDADDISLPDRLWKQVQLLRYYQADMISSGMTNFLADGETRLDLVQRVKPDLMPGRVYSITPHGACINGTRMFRRDLFSDVNGFANELCGMDFDFDNRVRLSGHRVVDDKTPRACRRLRSDSLSNGGKYGLIAGVEMPERTRTNAVVADHLQSMRDDPTIDRAYRLGSLSETPPITPLPTGMFC